MIKNMQDLKNSVKSKCMCVRKKSSGGGYVKMVKTEYKERGVKMEKREENWGERGVKEKEKSRRKGGGRE